MLFLYEFWQTVSDNRLLGSASLVLTATGFVNGKRAIFTHDGSNDADSRKDVPF